jgi:hypothetical protein
VRSLARAGHPPDLVLFYSSVLAQSPGSPPGGGAASGVDPPVPIPNTVVKRPSADDTGVRPGTIGRCRSLRRGVEQWQLVGLITRRSPVRIRPPLPAKPEVSIRHLGLLVVLRLALAVGANGGERAVPLRRCAGV